MACSTWLRVSTSSPTRFIIRLSRVDVDAQRAFGCGGRRPRCGDASSRLQERRELRPATGRLRAERCASSGAGAEAASGGQRGLRGTDVLAALALRAGRPPCCFFLNGLTATLRVGDQRRVVAFALAALSLDRLENRTQRRRADCSSPVMMGRSAASLPSRSRPSRFSPAWASFSSRLKPRNPVVPLIVCTERKISPSRAASPGRSSRLGQAALHAVQPFLAFDQEFSRQFIHCIHCLRFRCKNRGAASSTGFIG